jgi:Thoeris protein ThsB, TIR-like domain
MPGRRVFFSFHYELDVWRAANVRNAGEVDATTAAGWSDASIWEEAKKKGRAELERLIQSGLQGTSVTAVLIGSETANRPWVTYEIQQSINRGNGLIGVRIHKIKDQHGERSTRGPVPELLKQGGYQIYDWDRKYFGQWVEWAAIDAGKACLRHDVVNCFWCGRHWWS